MLTISNGIVLRGIDLNPIKANVLIDDGKIIEISENVSEGEIIDATDCIVCPSFLNGHTHIGDSIIKDIGDGKSIDELVKPPNGLKHQELSKCSDEEIISSMKESMWEMLSTGTTHFIDFREGGLKGIELLKEASKNIPINPTILGRDPIFYDENGDTSQIKKTAEKLLNQCDGIGLSGLNEVSEENIEIIRKTCEKGEKIFAIHVGEYEELQNSSLDETKKTEIERGVNHNFNLLIHCTFPKKNDLDLIAKNNPLITLCPRSNGTLSLGVPPVHKFLEKGIAPLLGSDNLMFNNPNMIREMEYTLKASRGVYKTHVSAKDILKMATVNVYNHQSNSTIAKTVIEEGEQGQLFITKIKSKNPFLSIINRTETSDIIAIINNEKIIK
ncbi:MAG: amidohydrolase family protein [Methanobrevibacter sp.]|jgi:cytosine/adenosine deaminase-related metal-dependent hydrolase|nr:amidohydrolase family protein [Methanobrevibacter sp.]